MFGYVKKGPGPKFTLEKRNTVPNYPGKKKHGPKLPGQKETRSQFTYYA